MERVSAAIAAKFNLLPSDRATHLIAADWAEENGEPLLAAVLRRGLSTIMSPRLSGYGSGNGDGSGSGSGSGSGDGYGDGSGSGYGYGEGDGDGYGYGEGDGYGYGEGEGSALVHNAPGDR